MMLFEPLTYNSYLKDYQWMENSQYSVVQLSIKPITGKAILSSPETHKSSYTPTVEQKLESPEHSFLGIDSVV